MERTKDQKTKIGHKYSWIRRHIDRQTGRQKYGKMERQKDRKTYELEYRRTVRQKPVRL